MCTDPKVALLCPCSRPYFGDLAPSWFHPFVPNLQNQEPEMKMNLASPTLRGQPASELELGCTGTRPRAQP